MNQIYSTFILQPPHGGFFHARKGPTNPPAKDNHWTRNKTRTIPPKTVEQPAVNPSQDTNGTNWKAPIPKHEARTKANTAELKALKQQFAATAAELDALKDKDKNETGHLPSPPARR